MNSLSETVTGRAEGRFPNSSFRSLWNAIGISQVGSAVTAVIVPLIAAVTLNASPGQMGVLAATGTIPSFLAKFPGAKWSDTLARPVPVMVACSISQGLVVGLIPLFWLLQSLTFAILLAIVATSSALAGIYGSLSAPVLVQVVPKQHLVDATGKISATRSTAEIAGPAAGGGLLAVMSAPLVILADALSFFACAALLTRVRTEPHARPPADVRDGTPSANSDSVVATGMRQIAGDLIRGSGMQALCAIAFINGITDAVLVLFMVDDLRMSPALIGLLLGLGAVGGIAGGLSVGRILSRFGLGATLAVGVVTTVLSLVLLPFSGPGMSALVAVVLFELTGSLGGTLIIATVFGNLQSGTPSDRIARVMAVASAFLQLATVAGLAAGGGAGTYLGLRTTLALAAGLLVLTLMPQLIRWHRSGWSMEA